MSDLRDAARQALEALDLCRDWPGAYDECSQAVTALKAALEQKPKFTLSCGCPSQYGGVHAYWDRDGSTAFGMICEKHWHEYGARSEA
jgi:uncharacterized protein YgiB involved in biofilm formation